MMVSFETFRQIATSFPEVTKEPHFEKLSFRVNKKIFATFDNKNNRACIKLSEIDQSVFSSVDKTIIYPVPNKWGMQGWTFIELTTIKKAMLKDLLTKAYCEVAPQKLISLMK